MYTAKKLLLYLIHKLKHLLLIIELVKYLRAHKIYKLYLTQLLGSQNQLQTVHLSALKSPSSYWNPQKQKLWLKYSLILRDFFKAQLIVAEYWFTKTGKYDLILAKLRILFLQHPRRQLDAPQSAICFVLFLHTPNGN